MAVNLQRWRRRNKLRQVDAAALLGVSQPYLSLLEKGARPVTRALRVRLGWMQGDNPQSRKKGAPLDDQFRAQLSALAYPGFAHVRPAKPKPHTEVLLVSVLSRANADARVVEALPWLLRRYADQLDLPGLVRQAKLLNLQNRLGFLLQASGVQWPEFSTAVAELERARLLQEDTLCWDSMPVATREWMRDNRSALAAHWNVVTTLVPESLSDAK